LIMCFDKCHIIDRHQVMKKINKNSLETIFLIGKTSHSFYNFLKDFRSFFWPCLPRQGYCVKFVIEYSSLRDFGLHVVGLFLFEDFWKMIFWLVFELDISYKVVISWRILDFLEDFFLRLYFVWWNIEIFMILLLLYDILKCKFSFEDFWKMIFWLVFKLEISYKVVISWRILVVLEDFFKDYILYGEIRKFS